MNTPEPSWRKPIGVLAIVVGLMLYGGLVMAVASWIGALPWPVQAILYCALGIAWVFPVRPTLTWMETGRWTAPRGGASDGT